eukprot:4287906-Amphidinium_carterae.1
MDVAGMMFQSDDELVPICAACLDNNVTDSSDEDDLDSDNNVTDSDEDDQDNHQRRIPNLNLNISL